MFKVGMNNCSVIPHIITRWPIMLGDMQSHLCITKIGPSAIPFCPRAPCAICLCCSKPGKGG